MTFLLALAHPEVMLVVSVCPESGFPQPARGPPSVR
jgi:hypothetical protein